MEVHARITVGRHQATAGDRLDLRSQLQQQGVGQRSVGYARGGGDVVVSEILAAPLLEQERLVDDAGKAWLEQTFGENIAFLLQFGIHEPLINEKWSPTSSELTQLHDRFCFLRTGNIAL